MARRPITREVVLGAVLDVVMGVAVAVGTVYVAGRRRHEGPGAAAEPVSSPERTTPPSPFARAGGRGTSCIIQCNEGARNPLHRRSSKNNLGDECERT
jgi:hypothetical protein